MVCKWWAIPDGRKAKNQILKDLDELNRHKVRAEARATLLNSRIQFIEINKNSNEQQ